MYISFISIYIYEHIITVLLLLIRYNVIMLFIVIIIILRIENQVAIN